MLIVMTGCSFQISGSAPADAPSGTVDTVDAMAIDSPPPGPCIAKWLDHTITVSAPVPLAGIDVGGASERDPFLTSDERTVFWVSPGPGGDDDVYQASRASPTGSFGTNAIKLSLTDNTQGDSKIALTADDLYGIQATSRSGGVGEADLWQVSRTTGGNDPFDTIDQQHLAALNDAGNQLDPFLTGDGLTLYYVIGSPQRIVVSTRRFLQADFAAPVDLASINGGSGDADPALSADGRVLLFSSNSRPGGFDYSDMWYATRSDIANPFGPPELVPTINGMQADGDAHLSRDGCRLYFASRRSGPYNLMFSTVQ